MVYPTSTQPSSSTVPRTLFGPPLIRSRMAVNTIDNPQTSTFKPILFGTPLAGSTISRTANDSNQTSTAHPILFGTPLVRLTSVTNPTENTQTSTANPILFGTPLVSSSGRNPIEITQASTVHMSLSSTPLVRSTSATNSIDSAQTRSTAFQRAPITSSVGSTIISTRRIQASTFSFPSLNLLFAPYPTNNQFPIMPTPSIPCPFFNSYFGFNHTAHPALRGQILGSTRVPSSSYAPSNFPWHNSMNTSNIYISLDFVRARLASWLSTSFPYPPQVLSEQVAVQNPNISVERRGSTRRFRCGRCDIEFPTHQAYGGHMSFHSKQDRGKIKRGESSRARPCKRTKHEPGGSNCLNEERAESSRARPRKRPREEPGGPNCLNEARGNAGNIGPSLVQEEKELQEYEGFIEDPGKAGAGQENPLVEHHRGDKTA